MNGYYSGKVKVVGGNMLCFPARVGDLEPLACGSYDPYAWSDPDPEPVETISVDEWNLRRHRLREDQYSMRGNGGWK